MTLDNAELAPAEVAEQPSHPLLPAGLMELYFHPRTFFSKAAFLGHRSALLIAAGLAGITGSMGQIDKKMVQLELSPASTGWFIAAAGLLNSWLYYWLVVLVAGLTWAAFLWYLGGWWYKKRLQWSGAADPSAILARRVYTLQAFVFAGPTVLLAMVQTVQYSSYLEAWRADEHWSSLIAVFVFWSCWTSYVAATTAFQVSKSKAIVWFLVLPIVLNVALLGIVGALYAVVGGKAA